MLTFKEFLIICEKNSNIPPHAVSGSYTEHPDGTKRYTLAPYEGPSGPATKSEIKNIVVKRSGGKEVEKSLPKKVVKDLKKTAKKAAKKISKIEEDIETKRQQLRQRQLKQVVTQKQKVADYQAS
jgi:hypothetical protein